MQLELLPGRGERQHLVVELLEGRARSSRPSRVPTRETWVSTGTSRMPNDEQQHAGRRLAPDAGERAQVCLRGGDARRRQPVQRERVPGIARRSEIA